MRRRRKAVQEQDGGSIPGTGFAIEDFQPLDIKRAIENGRRTGVCRLFPSITDVPSLVAMLFYPFL